MSKGYIIVREGSTVTLVLDLIPNLFPEPASPIIETQRYSYSYQSSELLHQ